MPAAPVQWCNLGMCDPSPLSVFDQFKSSQAADPTMPMIRASLRAYVSAVLRQWWTYAGIASGVIGYLLDVFTDLRIPPEYWIVGFATCFTVTQFLVYHDVRVALALRDRDLEIPHWAMHVCMANSDGAWLTVLLIGDAPKMRFNTTRYREIVTAIDQHFRLSAESRKVESFADVLRVTVPNGDAVAPEFQVQMGVHAYGVMCIQFRTQADPLPLFWLLQRLDSMMSFLLSDASQRVVELGNREYTFCLNAWPAGGIDTGSIVSAYRLSQNFVRGSRTMDTYKLEKDDRDGWTAIRAFASTVLANAGYTDFEPSLIAVTRHSLAIAAAGSTSSV